MFSDSLKLSDITPVYKKREPSDKANYRPVSVLPLLSKVFEKIIYDQLYEYLENFLSEFLCGLRKAHSILYIYYTLYSCGKDLPRIKEDLIYTMKNILTWFRLNSLKAHPGKFQFMILGDKTC